MHSKISNLEIGGSYITWLRIVTPDVGPTLAQRRPNQYCYVIMYISCISNLSLYDSIYSRGVFNTYQSARVIARTIFVNLIVIVLLSL